MDIGSDGEDEENIPGTVETAYRGEGIEELPGPDDDDYFYFLHESDQYVHNKINVMRGRFKFTETWVMLEAAYRFHRLAHRCLQNFRFHAIVARNARSALHQRKLKRMRRVFDALLGWMRRYVNMYFFSLQV